MVTHENIRIGSENFDKFILPLTEAGLSQKEAFEKLVNARPGITEGVVAPATVSADQAQPTSRQSVASSVSGPSEMEAEKLKNLKLKNVKLGLEIQRMKTKDSRPWRTVWKGPGYVESADPVSQQAEGPRQGIRCWDYACKESFPFYPTLIDHMKQAHKWTEQQIHAQREIEA
jgi:hypothetical protein